MPAPETQTIEELIKFVNTGYEKTNPTMHFFKGQVMSVDEKTMTAKLSFKTDNRMDNGTGMIQGGFPAAMLDGSCAYLVGSMLFCEREKTKKLTVLFDKFFKKKDHDTVQID